MTDPNLPWERQLREARLLLLRVGRERFMRITLDPAHEHRFCKQCFRCACVYVLVDDNEALAGGPTW